MKKILFIGLILLAACNSSTKSSSEEEKEIIVETSEDQTPREPVTFLRTSLKISNQTLADFQRARKKQKNIVYFCETQDGTLFLTANNKLEESELQNLNKKSKIRFGLSDASGNTLLPAEYEKIGNPGIYADGYVEVFKNGKYRLFDYINKRIMLEEFDVIFPSMIMGYLAVGKRSDGFYKMYDDGTITKINDPDQIPNYRTFKDRLNFNVQSEDFGLWINASLFEAENKEGIPAGMYITPSYLSVLKIIPSFISDVILKGSEFGTEKLETKKVTQQKRNKKINSTVFSFIEQGLDGRGWYNEKQHIVTTDEKNNVRGSKKLNDQSDFEFQNLCKNCDPTGFRFVNDSILEVKSWLITTDWDENKDLPIPGLRNHFEAMTHFSYFEISPEGKIKALYEDCIFPMASTIKLNRENLKGCFLKGSDHYDDITSFPLLPEYAEFGNEMDYPWILEFEHLTAKDLRFMINEVYARHGYIFADKKLNDYFRSMDWYSPKTKNVDPKLSKLEKENIQFLIKLEKELKENEKDILQPKRKFMVWAG